MGNWIPHAVARDYVVSPDWDNRWRSGGSVDQITTEAHLDPASLQEGLERFVADAEVRRQRMLVLLGGLGTAAET